MNDLRLTKMGRIILLTPSQAIFIVIGRTESFSITRRQCAMTAGSKFTGYQGQTIEYVLIDISPTGTLSPFSVYVALSRRRGREAITDFDPNLFQNHPLKALTSERKRIENEGTKSELLARGQTG
jgi:hypothetical protein